MLRSANSTPSRPISSKASTAPPVASLARLSSSSASSGVATPIIATAREAITGNSFSAAAVTTPSVPSAPIRSCLRS
jgi:hypothetical protein